MYLHVLNLFCVWRDETMYVCLYVHHFDMPVEFCRKQHSDYKPGSLGPCSSSFLSAL